MKRVVIKLSGSLAQRFGREHVRWLDTATVKEAMRSLKNTLDGFSEYILELDKKKTEFVIFKNRKNIDKDQLREGGCEEVRLVPIIAGSGGGNIFSTVLGAALFVGGAITGQTWLMALGGVMVLGGMLAAAQPKTPELGDEDGNKASYGFGGAVSTTSAGNCVPVLYGDRLVGGAYVSASITNKDIPV